MQKFGIKINLSSAWLTPILGFVLACSLTGAGAQEPSGADLVARLNCHACHALAGQGGKRGPAWDGLGLRLTPAAMKKQLVAPQGRMPNYAHLKPAELSAVVEYLQGLQ
jgi:mono/diheme cytochrome c family protein